MSRVLVGGTANYLGTFDPNGVLDPTTNAFTFGGWFRFTSNSGVSQIMFAKWNGTTGWVMFMQSSGVVRATINSSNADDTGAATLNVWTHFMARRDASTWKLYKNGVEVASNGAAASLGATSHAFHWGHRVLGATSAMNGRIAEFAAWSDALTPAEIAAVAAGVSPFLVRPKDLVYQPGWGVNTGREPDLAGPDAVLDQVGSVAVADHAPVGPTFPLAA